ncbi:MAG: hypothetical protein IPK21_21810 [Haliscomenobacter sp.]|nr:hypothetical protein [Haliscomenobacter sp.]
MNDFCNSYDPNGINHRRSRTLSNNQTLDPKARAPLESGKRFYQPISSNKGGLVMP